MVEAENAEGAEAAAPSGLTPCGAGNQALADLARGRRPFGPAEDGRGGRRRRREIAEAGTAEAATAEAATAEAGPAEAGTAEAGTAEAGTAEAGTAEAGT
ncbi:MAG: hypothetical protein ABFE07_03990, partial [Armatimonadia bacterium]